MDPDLERSAARIRRRLASTRALSGQLNTTSAGLRTHARELMAVSRERRARRLGVPVLVGCRHCGATAVGAPTRALVFLREHPYHCSDAESAQTSC